MNVKWDSENAHEYEMTAASDQTLNQTMTKLLNLT